MVNNNNQITSIYMIPLNNNLNNFNNNNYNSK